MTGRHDSQYLLEQLESMNLFLIRLDDDRQWYRYHHLFATLLQHRLRQKGTQQNLLYQRAATWYENQEIIEEAIRYYRLADDVVNLSRLIRDHAGLKHPNRT